MPTSQQSGRDFEKEFGDEFGLGQTPASGAVWFSKLDLKGLKTRWSLKHTDAKTFTVDKALIDEAVEATQGFQGDGSIPLWAFRIGGINETMVMLRKDDFKLIQEGESLLDMLPSRSDERRNRASIPVLLREEE